jgi:hypothetical protein
VAALAAPNPAIGGTPHRITNQRVERSGDDLAARSYVDIVVTSADGRIVSHTAGFYDDVVVEAADGWRIAARVFTLVAVWGR